MKHSIFTGLAGIMAVLALLFMAPFLVPASLYRTQIEQSITRATGRAFTISGPLHFSLFPSLAIRADKVALANLPGRSAPSLATADDIRFGVQLWPLFSRRIEITQIVLNHPTVNLEVDAEGHANWLLEREQRPSSPTAQSRTMLVEQFSGIKIEHGRVTYSNLRSRSSHAFGDVDAILGVTQLDQLAQADGAFTFANRRMAFRIKTATPRLLLQERVASVDFSATSELLQATFKGTIAPNGVLNGVTKIETPSMRDVGTWLGARLPQTDGLGPLSLESHIDGDNQHVRLEAMALKLDGMTIKGDIALDTTGTLPRGSGNLTVDHLDLNPYTERPRKPGLSHPHRDNESWSDEPIALDSLKKVNADLTLDVGSLTLRKLQLGKAHIVVALENAQLTARLDPIALYGGTGKATFAIDARRTPVFHNAVEFNNVALQPFLSSTIGVKQIEGTGTIKLDVTSNGDSADAIMHRISGKGAIEFRDGQLHGVDLGAVAKTIQSVTRSVIQPGAFTKYTAMSGTFVLAHGVLTNNDFQLAGPVLHVTGAGTVDIGNRAIDFKMVPQASAVIAKQKLSVGLPFRINGPWKHIHYTADVAGLVNSVLDNLKSGRAPFKGVFGSPAPKDPNAPKKKHKNIGDALKNMLGIH